MGTRTPYGPGRPWPVRVDCHLAEGIAHDDVDRWVRTAAVLHSNGDGMDIAVKDGRIVGVRGRADDRLNLGRLDPKDLFGWQANNSADRLTVSLVREDGRLRLEQVVAVFARWGGVRVPAPSRAWSKGLFRCSAVAPTSAVCRCSAALVA